MKELIEKIIAYIPAYLLSLGKLLAQPKRFLAETQPDTEVGFRNGLQFLSVSIVLGVIATAPLAPKASDIWTRVATLSIFEVLGVAAMACALRLAWRIAGGRSSIRSFFTLYAYTSSVVVLLTVLTILISDGTAKVFNPVLYEAVMKAQSLHQPIPGDVAGSKAFVAAFIVLVCGFQMLSVWAFVTWGAFRALNAATRIQSVAALMLTSVMGWAITFVGFIIGRAMNPTQ